MNAEDEDGSTPLIYAACSDTCSEACVQILLDKGADVNVCNTYGDTALLWAIMKNEACALLLIKSGVNVNHVKTGYDETLVMKAATEGKTKCLKVLMRAGANVNGGKFYSGLVVKRRRGSQVRLRL